MICKIYNIRCEIEIRTVVAVPFQSWAAGSDVIRGKLRPCRLLISISQGINCYQIFRIILKDILRIFVRFFLAFLKIIGKGGWPRPWLIFCICKSSDLYIWTIFCVLYDIDKSRGKQSNKYEDYLDHLVVCESGSPKI